MPSDRNDLGNKTIGATEKPWVDAVIDYRKYLAGLVILATIVLAFFIPRLQTEPSLKLVVVTSGLAYQDYERFLDSFGNDDFLVVAVRNEQEASDQRVLKALAKITEKLAQIPKVTRTTSLSNLKFFQKKGDLLGMYPVLQRGGGVTGFPGTVELEKLRTALPLLDLLLSQDLKTVGVVVRLDGQAKHDPGAIERILESVNAVVMNNLPYGSEYRVVGPPVIRQALKNYAVRTAVIFGVACTIISLLVAVYVFRNLTVSLITLFIIAISVVSVLGLMAAMAIPLSATTSMAFGLIIITTTNEMVIHIVVRYRQFRQLVEDRIEAARAAIRYLLRPFIMCSATTAVGFGTCIISDVPIVTHLGVVMPVGILAAWCLSLVLTPYLILRTKAVDTAENHLVVGHRPIPLVERLSAAIARHNRLFVMVGLLISALMLAGIPFIRVESQLVRQLKDSNQEVQDIRFVERTLTPVHYLELMLEVGDQGLGNPEVWKKVKDLDERLKELSEVVAVESYLPLLTYVDGLIKGPDYSPEDLWTNPMLIPQLRFLMSMSPEGKDIASRYIDQDNNRVRISVRIKNSSSVALVDTLEEVRATAETVMKGVARPVITGELALVGYNGANLVRSEILAMAIGLALIAVLMMIQMGTPLSGLLSLIPNIPPLATVFGIMGWLHVDLDTVTVFAANVALGLAVDNTIQYVAQLKREIQLNPESTVQECVLNAYRLAAPPMASWSLVIALGFLTLILAPIRAPVIFGLLLSSAILMGMFGDLIFLPSTILASRWVRRVIQQVIEKESTQAGTKAGPRN